MIHIVKLLSKENHCIKLADHVDQRYILYILYTDFSLSIVVDHLKKLRQDPGTTNRSIKLMKFKKLCDLMDHFRRSSFEKINV